MGLCISKHVNMGRCMFEYPAYSIVVTFLGITSFFKLAIKHENQISNALVSDL